MQTFSVSPFSVTQVISISVTHFNFYGGKYCVLRISVGYSIIRVLLAKTWGELVCRVIEVNCVQTNITLGEL